MRCATLALIALLVTGCAVPTKIVFRPIGFIDCFRLDREPLSETQEANCVEGAADLAVGNLHRDPAKTIIANTVPQHLNSEMLNRLPMSECLWTGQSNSGNGDSLELYWEGYHNFESPGENSAVTLHSACRLDPPFARISAALAATERFREQGLNTCLQAFHDGGTVHLVGWVSFEQLKSTCDLDPYPVLLEGLAMASGPYGLCRPDKVTGAIAPIPPNAPIPAGLGLTGGFRRDAGSACAPADGEGLITYRPNGSDNDPDYPLDVRLRVRNRNATSGSSDGVKLLQPALMTVRDTRRIARPLSMDATGYRWQGEISIAGPPGRQRWLENFTDNVRVVSISVFTEFNDDPEQREYQQLNGSELRIIDPDSPGAQIIATLAGDQEQFAIASSSLDLTPTYRVSNLTRPGLDSLSDPLIWQLSLPDVPESGRHYIEFELISTYRSRQAAIRLDRATADFGRVVTGSKAQKLIQITNVGSGHFTIDSAGLDPYYGNPYAFSVERLDDPVMMPYLFYLEPTGAPAEFRAGIQAGWADQPLIDYREFETHSSLAATARDGLQLDIEGVPVLFSGQTAVAMVAKPTFNGSSQIANRIYPFRYPVYQVWDLPFILAPGEQRSVIVTVAPTQIGIIKGQLSISGYPSHAPNSRQTASSFLEASGSSGAIANVMPAVLRFPYGAEQATTLNAIVVNAGDADLLRGDLSIRPSDDIGHPQEDVFFKIVGSPQASATIGVGDSELVSIEYDPGCYFALPIGGRHHARLLIDTDVGRYEIALRGDPQRATNANPSCHPGP